MVRTGALLRRMHRSGGPCAATGGMGAHRAGRARRVVRPLPFLQAPYNHKARGRVHRRREGDYPASAPTVNSRQHLHPMLSTGTAGCHGVGGAVSCPSVAPLQHENTNVVVFPVRVERPASRKLQRTWPRRVARSGRTGTTSGAGAAQSHQVCLHGLLRHADTTHARGGRASRNCALRCPECAESTTLLARFVECQEKAKKIAVHLLEVSEEDLVWEVGKFSVKGAPQKFTTIQDIAFAAYTNHPQA